ncbi:PAS-domain containing protein [Teichococcus vastitatis]|uniref:PAS-domain containing protein n=1 Tax=Teichococcus vastitatis TaxID=2307076 RepID=UPI0013905734|nr:PAS-domain containing protein [Pseudoroseomonas vastitatis]
MTSAAGRDEAEAALQLLLALPSAALVFDAEHRLVLANGPARALLALPAEDDPRGTPAEDLIRRLAYRGIYGSGDPEAHARTALALDRSQPVRRLVCATDGRWFEIARMPLPDGGWASVVTDVTRHRHTEAAARDRLRLFDTALRHNPSGIAIYDQQHRLVLFNEPYEALLNLPAGTLGPGLPINAVIDLIIENMPLDPETQARLDARRNIDRSQRSQIIGIRSNGITVRATSQPLPDGGFLIGLEDVTPMRQAEDEAKRRAAMLDGILAALPHGVCVYGPDRRLRMVNAAFRRIVGDGTVMLGEHLMDILRRREATGEYAAPEAVEEVFRRQFDFDRPPTTRIRTDGRVLTGKTAPLPDGGHISVVSDVTALHRAEAEAQRRAALLQVMMDNMRHGVCLFDRDNRVVAANTLACRMTGLTREEMAPGAPLRELRRLQFERGQFGRGPEAERIFRTRATNVVPTLETFTRSTAEGRMIEVSTDPTPDGGFVRIYTDVTAERRALAETERARAAAEEASNAKTRFLATMSHELRTPLNAVIGFSEALAAEPGPPHVAEFASSILEAGRHLLGLIDEVLAVAQAGTGALQVETRALFLPSVLQGAVRLMRPTAEAAAIILVLEPLPELPRIRADERRLRQILLNLVANAVKFTPAGGSVRIAAAPVADGVEVTVSDTGIGMSPEQVERAFEPFVQLETSHARRYGGSGLGLYLARALAQAMEGSLVLDSQRGAGTTARLRLTTAMQPQEQTA